MNVADGIHIVNFSIQGLPRCLHCLERSVENPNRHSPYNLRVAGAYFPLHFFLHPSSTSRPTHTPLSAQNSWCTEVTHLILRSQTHIPSPDPSESDDCGTRICWYSHTIEFSLPGLIRCVLHLERSATNPALVPSRRNARPYALPLLQSLQSSSELFPTPSSLHIGHLLSNAD